MSVVCSVFSNLPLSIVLPEKPLIPSSPTNDAYTDVAHKILLLTGPLRSDVSSSTATRASMAPAAAASAEEEQRHSNSASTRNNYIEPGFTYIVRATCHLLRSTYLQVIASPILRCWLSILHDWRPYRADDAWTRISTRSAPFCIPTDMNIMPFSHGTVLSSGTAAQHCPKRVCSQNKQVSNILCIHAYGVHS